MEHSLCALLAQHNDEGHEQAIYYLSRTLLGAEHRYHPVEKECLALVFAVQKMRHYLVGQTIYVVSKVNPLRLLMSKPSSLNGCFSSLNGLSCCHNTTRTSSLRRLSKDKPSQTLWQKIRPPDQKN